MNIRMSKVQAVLDDNEATSIPELLEDYLKQGHGPTQIANFIGVDRRSLHRWAKHFGVALPERCAKHAFPKQPMPDGCLAKSVEVCSAYVEYNGQRLRVADEAKRLGITSQALRYRLKHWPSLEEALTQKRTVWGGRQCES